MKRFFSVCLGLILWLSLWTPVCAANSTVVLLAGEQMAVADSTLVPVDQRDLTVYPFIVQDRLLIPVRTVSELFGAQVDWNGQTKEITIVADGRKSVFAVGKTYPELGIDVPAQIVKDITFVPVRAVAQSMLGKKVSFDGNTKATVISDRSPTDEELARVAGSAKSMIQASYQRDGLSLDKKYYTVGGRVYGVQTVVKNVPYLDVNFIMMDDRAKRDMASLMETVSFPVLYLDQSGAKKTGTNSVTVRREVAAEVKTIFQEIYDAGGLLRPGDAGAFRLSGQDFGAYGKMTLPNHPNGVAIDLNVNSNPYGYYTEDMVFHATVGQAYDPAGDPYSFAKDGIVVSTFKKHGWGWGGDWNSWKGAAGAKQSYRDFMHFSINGN